jgi:ABC-type transporter Mla subunit MlaD
MRIKKFNELNTALISSDKTKELIDKLSNLSNDFHTNMDIIFNVMNDIEIYVDDKSDKNNQIDDSYLELKLSKSKLKDIINSIDKTISNLNNYIDKGSSYMY